MIRTLEILSELLAAPDPARARAAGSMADALFDDGALSPVALAEVDHVLGALAREAVIGEAVSGEAADGEAAAAHLALFLGELAARPVAEARRRLRSAARPLHAARARLEHAGSPRAGVLVALTELAACGAASGPATGAAAAAAISPVGSAGAEWHNRANATVERGAP